MTRTARIERTTNETKVIVEVNLDGHGRAAISTGVGMFDHLLTAFAHHSLIDLIVSTEGDLEVDDHHTVEDTMLVLGSAIDEALGDRDGITRYGDAMIPMDEAVATVAIDYGGRPYAVVEVPFRADRIGELSTQLIEHAIEAFVRTARATLNVTASGRNDHHVAEATFKALARATRMAVELDPRRRGVPSTKGSL
ncbi:MAG: imidazoleglycerol-phosphate dehydratase HisB [Acidimicrobiia bacterium]|nr:MAG: imidazoleglycerol-phosphate dehydratase HisB [Acidimicrobiia bacterium]